MLTPISLQPRVFERIWGGSRLAQWRGSQDLGRTPLGESWEIHGGLPVKGLNCSLDQLTLAWGSQLLGKWCRHHPQQGFPLLTKWLDCQDWLSIQVHPDDEVAERLEGPGSRGKAEAWYFAEVQPMAEVIHGWQEPPPPLIEPDQWLPKVRRYQPQPGTWCYTGPGTLHALGPGLLVFEVQQSSDLTYRLYDWGRPRPTHWEQALQALQAWRPARATAWPDDLLGTPELACEHFLIERVEGCQRWSPGSKSMELLTSLSPQATVHYGQQSWPLQWGDSLLLPADLGPLEWEGQGSWVRVRLPPPD